MRTANLVVSGLGVAALVVAAFMAWRWRDREIRPAPFIATDRRAHFVDAVRSFGVVLTAGVVSGLLVLGFGGRLVMRVLAAASGDSAQGRVTEAGEAVGAITFDGTVGFLIFIGLGGGVLTSVAYLAVRRWLPDNAGQAGLIGAALMIGTLGVVDPLSPDNVDFAILSPRWFAVAILLATAVLFVTTFTGLAAYLEARSTAPGSVFRRWSSAAALPLGLIPPFVMVLALYVGGRTAMAGHASRWFTAQWSTRAGTVVLAVAVLLTMTTSLVAASSIVID